METEELRKGLAECIEILDSINGSDIMDDARIAKLKRLQKRLLKAVPEPDPLGEEVFADPNNLYDSFFNGL